MDFNRVARRQAAGVLTLVVHEAWPTYKESTGGAGASLETDSKQPHFFLIYFAFLPGGNV